MFKRITGIILSIAVSLSFMSVLSGTASAQANDIDIFGISTSLAGDCTLIKSNGEFLLVDLGSKDEGNYIADKLESLGVGAASNLSIMVSHLHNDHYGDYATLFKRFNVNKVYLPDYNEVCPEYEHASGVTWLITDAYKKSGKSERGIEYLGVGDSFSIGCMRADVIGPVGTHHPNYNGTDYGDTDDGKSDSKYDKYLNNSSLVVKFTAGDGFSLLCAGDIEADEEAALVKKYGNTDTLKSDVFKLNHHGMETDNTEAFIDAVKPSYTYAENKNHVTYHSINYAAKYGFVFAVGYEGENFRINHTLSGGNKVYKGDEELSGLVTMEGPRTEKFKNESNKIKYYLVDGEPKKGGIIEVDGAKYVFNDYMSEKGYYDESGSSRVYVPFEMYNAQSEGRRAYDEECRMYEGLTKLTDQNGEERLYYFDEKTGYRATGLKKVGNNSYYFMENPENYTYNTGYAYNKGFKTAGNEYRYFNSDGTMKTGWATINSKKYYFDTKTGYRLTGRQKIGKYNYYFTEYGTLYTSGWKKEGSKYFYTDKNGVIKTGWQTISSKKYYFDTKTGYRLTGRQKIGKYNYYFTEYGTLYTSGWKKEGSKYFYTDKNGVIKTGWQTISSKKYYFDTKTGYRVTGIKKIGKNTYYFDSYGKQHTGTGFKKFGKNYRYFKKGVMKTGWQTISSKKYYFDTKTGYRVTGIKKIGKNTYYFDSYGKQHTGTGFKKFGKNYRYFKKGVMKTGWLTLGKKKYYLNTKTGYRVTGKQKIGKKTYYFTSSGVLKK